MDQQDKFSVPVFIGDLDAGNVEARFGLALREVAAGLKNLDKERAKKVKGKVSIEITMQRMTEDQMMITAKLTSAKPTARGKKSEEDSADTLMYVSSRGNLSITPEYQTGFGWRKPNEERVTGSADE